jgi:hypothetical protein
VLSIQIHNKINLFNGFNSGAIYTIEGVTKVVRLPYALYNWEIRRFWKAIFTLDYKEMDITLLRRFAILSGSAIQALFMNIVKQGQFSPCFFYRHSMRHF